MAWSGAQRCRLRLVIILDTNVLSALMRTSPDVAVVSWLDRTDCTQRRMQALPRRRLFSPLPSGTLFRLVEQRLEFLP